MIRRTVSVSTSSCAVGGSLSPKNFRSDTSVSGCAVTGGGTGAARRAGLTPSITATQRKSSVFSKAILTITVSGTESSIPTGPQTQPQKTNDKITTRVESPSRRPMKYGSTKLASTMLMTT